MAKYTGRIGQRELLSYIDPHPGRKGSETVPGTCGRCGGSGYTCFVWVHNGICFQCGGNGNWPITINTVRKHARADAYQRDYAPELAAHDELQRYLEAEAWHIEDQRQRAEEAAREAERQANMVQGFIAPIGDKIAGIDITVKVAKYIPGTYNRSSRMFVVGETDTGQVVMFGGSAKSVMALERGDKATILTGKVKDHDAYNGQDQTVLSHVKVEIHQEQEEAA